MPNPHSTSSKITNPPRGRQQGDDPAQSVPPTPQDTVGTVDDPFAALPTETEIYILPGGEIVIADLPAELAGLLSAAGVVDPESHTPDPTSDPMPASPATPTVPTAGS